MRINDLAGPLVLVTGGGSGIGRATVQRLLTGGCRVIALDRSAPRLERLVQDQQDERLVPVVFDLLQTGDLGDLVGGLCAEHGPITGLVNNAGIFHAGGILETSDEQWDAVLTINLTAPFVLIREVAAGMAAAGGGSIVNVASRNAFRSSTTKASYDASKAGLLGLTRTACGELARHHIRVNAVCPGVVATEIEADTLSDPLYAAAYQKQIPMSRYGRPEEIASVIAFLLSDDAGFISGQPVIADGGQIACQDNKRFMEIPALKA